MQNLIIKTHHSKQIIDITDKLNSILKNQKKSQGMLFLNILHTTASVTTTDLDPGTDLDMLDAFYTMIPKLNYRHPHNPSHVPDHILSTLIGTSISLPFQNHSLILGTWQRVVVIEFDGPRERNLIVNLVFSEK